MKKTILLLLLAFSFLIAADSITGAAYPDPGCSSAAGTVLDPVKPGDLAIADILLKNDQPFLYVPENLCTAAKVFIVATDAKVKALAAQQRIKPEEVRFDVELHFRDVAKGFTGIPLKLTSVELHKLDPKSPFKKLGQGANQKTYDWGGFVQIAGTPKYLSFLGIGKGSGAGNTYKVVAVVKLKDDKTPLLCRYWYHAQGTDNKQSGVLKIVADDLETIYSTSGTPVQVKESAQLKRARTEWKQLQALSSSDSKYKKKVESFADAYLAFLKFEAGNGNSQLFLTQDQRNAAIALTKDPRYRASIINGLVGSFFQIQQVAAPAESQKDRLVRYLTHYREVVRAAVKIREFNLEALQKQSADKNWFTFWVPNLRQLAESIESERQGQTYEVGDGVFPRQPTRDEDRAYNILAEQLASEKERLVAVSYLLNLVKDDTIKPEDLPQPNELDAINQNGLDRFTAKFSEKKSAAPAGSQAARFFEDRTGKRRFKELGLTPPLDSGASSYGSVIEFTSLSSVSEFGSFLPYSALIQKDVRVNPRMQAVLYAGLVTDATRKPVYEATYEQRTIGQPTGPKGPDGKPTRVGGYLKGEVPQAFFKALDASSIRRDGFFGAESYARAVGEYLDLAMAIPLSNFLSGASKLISPLASKLAPKLGFLKLTGPAAATVAEAHTVFRGATVIPKAAASVLKSGATYVVDEIVEVGGKRFAILSEGTKTGVGQGVKVPIEEFEALARAGQVTLAKEGVAAMTGLSKAGSSAVEKEAVNLARTPSNLGRIMMTPLNEFKFFQNKVFTNAFSRAIGKTIQYITQTASRPVGDVFSGFWGKFTKTGLGQRLSTAFKRGPAAVNTELQAQKAAGNAIIAETADGQKIIVDGAETAGTAARPGGTSRALFDEALSKAAGTDAAAWKSYADGLKGKKIVVTSPGELEFRQGVITGAGSAPGELTVEFEGFGFGKGTRTIKVAKTGGTVFEELLPVAPGTIAPTASEISDVVRTGRFQGQAISWNDFVNQFLKGQKIKITSQTFAGEVGEVIGPSAQKGGLRYRVTQASPDVAPNLKDAAVKRVGLEIEITTDERLGAGGRGSFEVLAPEIPAGSAASPAAAVVKLEIPVFEDFAAALKSGDFSKFGVNSWAGFVEKYKGARFRITSIGPQKGEIGEIVEALAPSADTGGFALRYKVITPGDGFTEAAGRANRLKQPQTIRLDPSSYSGSGGPATSIEFTQLPPSAANAGAASLPRVVFQDALEAVKKGPVAWKSFVEGNIGRRIKVTVSPGALGAVGREGIIEGVSKNKFGLTYRADDGKLYTVTVNPKPQGLGHEFEFIDASGGVQGAGADVVLTGRRIPAGVDPVRVAAAAAGGPAALAAAGFSGAQAASIPASAVTAIRLLPTYKGSQLLVLGALHPDTQKLIPADVAIPPMQLTSTGSFTVAIGKACEGGLDAPVAGQPAETTVAHRGESLVASGEGTSLDKADLSATKRCIVSEDKKTVTCWLAEDKAEHRCSEWLKDGYGVCLSSMDGSKVTLQVSGRSGMCEKGRRFSSGSKAGFEFSVFGVVAPAESSATFPSEGPFDTQIKCGSPDSAALPPENSQWSFTTTDVREIQGVTGKVAVVKLTQLDEAVSAPANLDNLNPENSQLCHSVENGQTFPGITCNLKPWATSQRCTEKSPGGHVVCADWTDDKQGAQIRPIAQGENCVTLNPDVNVPTDYLRQGGINYAQCGGSQSWGYSYNKEIKPGVVSVTICDQAGKC